MKRTFISGNFRAMQHSLARLVPRAIAALFLLPCSWSVLYLSPRPVSFFFFLLFFLPFAPIILRGSFALLHSLLFLFFLGTMGRTSLLSLASRTVISSRFYFSPKQTSRWKRRAGGRKGDGGGSSVVVVV